MEKLKYIPALRFPEFKGEWEKKKLGEISDKVMYGMNSSAIEFDGINKYLRITDIDESSREFIPKPLVSPSGYVEERYKLRNGDIVFTRTGASVGKTYLYNPKDGNLLFAGFLIKFSIIEGNPFFIFSQTLKESYNKWVLKMSMRSGQPGLNSEECKDLELYFPSLPEQTKIASFLTTVDDKLQALKQKKTLLEQHKKGVMQKLFSQELRFKDDNGSEFPQWEKKKLGNVLIKNSKKNKGQEFSLVQSVSNKHGFINQDEMFEDRRVASNDTSNYYVIEKGYFAYNPSRIDVGSLAYKFDNITSVISPLYISFKTNSAFLNDEFLLEWFSTQQFTRQMNSSFEGSVRNTLSYESLTKIEINFPCLEEQIKIANFLSAIDDKINHCQSQIEKMEIWKKGLLQQMFV
jgi:type I restriction enzyme S subunit